MTSVKRIDSAAALCVGIALVWPGAVQAQACAEEVLRNLFAELEAIDVAGEQRLAQSLDRLSAQEAWSATQRSNFTAALAEAPQVEAAEAERGRLIAELYGLVQRGEVDCATIDALHAQVLALEEAQWDTAVGQVEQRIFH
jgi:hypothetical protein